MLSTVWASIGALALLPEIWLLHLLVAHWRVAIMQVTVDRALMIVAWHLLLLVRMRRAVVLLLGHDHDRFNAVHPWLQCGP